MGHIRSALYLDFDNVFSGIYSLDPEVAVRFATEPGEWLGRLAGVMLDEHERRWLVLRCYLNPGGRVKNPDPTADKPWIYFNWFRKEFVRAGFEVVDCPPYTATMKNGADIRLVVDVLDALADGVPCEEYVIASGDSDMTPLLQRLRRADRYTMLACPAESAAALTSVADRVLDSQWLLALVQGGTVEFDDEDETGDLVDGAFYDGDGVSDGLPRAAPGEGYERFRERLTAEYDGAAEPLNMASLAHALRDEMKDVITATDWFGYGGFARAVNSLRLPGLRMSQHFLWDEGRHTPPEGQTAVVLPAPVERLAEWLNLPRLPRDRWPWIYRALSEYAHTHRFNLAECTSWTRDHLRDQGVAVSRGAVAFVARGTALGGCPLHRTPPPSADEIATAFTTNVIGRVAWEEAAFTDEDQVTVRDWLGVANSDGAALSA